MKRTTFKKFALLTMFLLSFSFILTGCTLFERNLSKYYNTVVATVQYDEDTKLEITKRELITAFNNYGANLVQNYSYTVEKAMDTTLNQLINQKLLIKESEKLASYTNADKNALWVSSTQALDSYLKTYVEEVEKAWNVKRAEQTTPETEETVVKYTPYAKKVELTYENDNLVLKYVETEKPQIEEELKYTQMQDIENKETIVNSLYNYINQKSVFNTTNTTLTEQDKYNREVARVNAEAIRRLTTALKQSEKGLRLSTDNESVLKRALEKIYLNQLENLKLDKISKIITPKSNFSNVTINSLLRQYESMIGQSYDKYKIKPTELDTDMLGTFGNVNYTSSQDYFFVSHILLKFSAKQQLIYDGLEERVKSGEISMLEKQNIIDGLIADITAVERDAEGKVLDSALQTKKAEDVLLEVTRKLDAKADSLGKAQAFKELLYKYNQDDGALNSEYLYVIGTETSKMVETFTKAARDLHNEGKGTFGSVSALVPSEFGVHIVFYAGSTSSVIPFVVGDIDNFSLTEEDVWVLNETILNPLNTDISTSKTLLDKVFEKFTESTSTSDQTMYINNLKKDMKIEKHKSNYQDLLK